MVLPKSVLRVSLLLTLCACAFGVANASATTLYICTPVGPEGNFQDPHCSTPGAGNYKTVKAPAEQHIKTTEPSKFTLTTTIGGLAIKVSCATMSGSGIAETIVNEKKENEVKGSGLSLKFSECVVEEPAGKGCVVKGGGFEGTELSSITSMATQEEPTAVSLTPAAGKSIADVVLEKCSLSGLNSTFKIGGTALATVGAVSRSELVFTKAGTEAGGLTVAGQKAGLAGTVHTIVNGGEGSTVSIETP